MTMQFGVLFKNLFSTEEMRDLFSEENFIRNFLKVEAALARAEAKADVIPEEAAKEITEKATLDYVDMEKIEKNVEEIGLFSMSIIKAWREEVGEVGEYIHWGATTQDISDTALMIQIKEGNEIVFRDLQEIRESLKSLAKEHKNTPMIGRTHQVHAIPITFGLKVCTWLDEVDRHIQRLKEAKDRVYAAEFFGATGTLGSIGEKGIEVQENLEEELDLEMPDIAWFSSRDRIAEVLSNLSMIASTLGKISKNILILNREEIREVQEPIPEGEVGSSTMPHKKNPVRNEMIVALSRLVRSQSSLMYELMYSADGRDASTWFDEFAVVPEVYLYLSGILRNMKEIAKDLTVNTSKMETNLNIHGGLVTSEALMMKLAEKMGRQTAHEIVYENAMKAIKENKDFKKLVKSDDRITGVLSDEELDFVMDPKNYTGLSDHLVERRL